MPIFHYLGDKEVAAAGRISTPDRGRIRTPSDFPALLGARGTDAVDAARAAMQEGALHAHLTQAPMAASTAYPFPADPRSTGRRPGHERSAVLVPRPMQQLRIAFVREMPPDEDTQNYERRLLRTGQPN